jgi:glucokinase
MAKYCIGIDLGGTFIKFGSMDVDRRPGPKLQLPTPMSDGPDGVVNQMIDGARQLMKESGLSVKDVAGVGIGSPGPIDIPNGTVISLPNIPGMENVQLRDRVAGGLGLTGVRENDANAAAFGEYLCGAGKGRGDMVLLTLGTGVGSGIVVDGKVLHGAHGVGAEIGHIIVDPGGEQCNCGQKGCLERYSSATFLAHYATRLIEKEKRASSLVNVLRAGKSIDSKAVLEAAQAGDALAKEVWDRATYYLAIGCIDICRIFDPETILLGGGLIKAGDALLTPVREHFSRLHWKVTGILTEIKLASLGNDAGVLGAAGVAWQKLKAGTGH